MPVLEDVDHQEETERQAKQLRHTSPVVALLLAITVGALLWISGYFIPLNLRFGRIQLEFGCTGPAVIPTHIPRPQISSNGRRVRLNFGPDLSGMKSYVIGWSF